MARMRPGAARKPGKAGQEGWNRKPRALHCRNDSRRAEQSLERHGHIPAPLRAAAAAAKSLADVAPAMAMLASHAGATRYLLLDLPKVHAAEATQIVACDWPHVAVEIFGLPVISRIALAAGAVAMGAAAGNFRRVSAVTLDKLVDEGVGRQLAAFGMREFASLQIHAGVSDGLLLLSSDVDGSIDLDRLATAQMLGSYLWSKLNAGRAPQPLSDPLSARERECLLWVSEGKTTEEVAVILGVSANTVNRYILHATQKLSAANRSMAIAVAIRNGMV